MSDLDLLINLEIGGYRHKAGHPVIVSVYEDRYLDALGRGSPPIRLTTHSNGSGNFCRNARSAAVVPSMRFR